MKNPFGKCLGCGLPMIGDALLCAHCSKEYPGLIEKAKRSVKREIAREEREILRQEEIANRRHAMRCV